MNQQVAMSKVTPLSYDDLTENEEKELDKGILFDATIFMKYHSVEKVNFTKKVNGFLAKVEVVNDICTLPR
jgi:hypothetical protein